MEPAKLKTAVKEADASALQALVDNFFAGLEARTTNPIVVGLLKGANKLIDFAMTAYGLALLLALLLISGANAQGLPRARDAVDSYASLPRARDSVYVDGSTFAAPAKHLNGWVYASEDESAYPYPAKVDPPCKNCDCGCAEGEPCKCDKPGAAKTQEIVTKASQVEQPSTPVPSTTPTSASAGTDEAGVYYPAPAPTEYRAPPFFRYRPVYQRASRSCSS